MKKVIIAIILILVVIGAGYYYYAKDGDLGPLSTFVGGGGSSESRHFEEQLTAQGIAQVGQPIEGFDANLLITAFPGLVEADFSEVKTAEGTYVLRGTSIAYVQNEGVAQTSAGTRITSDGFEQLLFNVSGRLGMPALTDSEIDQVIARIKTRAQ